MWFFVLILTIAFLSGSQAQEDDCNDNPIPRCIPEGSVPFSFPQTEENLIETCSKEIEFLECILNYAKRCRIHHIDEMEGYKLGMVRVMCNRETPLFHAIARNLKCLKTVVEKYEERICYGLTLSAGQRFPRNDFQKIYDLFMKRNNTEEEMELRTCYIIAFESACGVAQISLNCGNETKEIAQRALSESNLLEELCKPKHFIVVKEFAKYLDEEADKIRV